MFRLEQTSAFLGVLSLHCLNLGCQHVVLRHSLPPVALIQCRIVQLIGACPVFDRWRGHYFHPLSRKGVSLFLEREDGLRKATPLKEILDLV